MPPADFNLRNGSTIQPNLARQLLLAQPTSSSAGCDAGSDLDPCLPICHSAIIALSPAGCDTERRWGAHLTTPGTDAARSRDAYWLLSSLGITDEVPPLR